ncbi:stemmadenine O-acetyltransferase-like [Euphorbia lathyris]|uniref:stemmadenine O-acetyltransferase-like n=1 Tax=Euphorbia lathyris TaxID=212925 RepID=UPI0033139A98
MKMETKIISKEFIKPSSPTPYHLRHLHFSFLDQFHPHIFVPFIYFYPKKSLTNSERSKLLKKSLSKVLTIFYPAAGRVRNSYIDCNDEGLLFVEAKVNCELSDVLRDRNLNNNNCFVPPRLHDLAGCSQITFFNCGGIALSLSLSHKVCDLLSFITFLNCWTSIARRDMDTDTGRSADMINNIPPFGSAKLFPPMDEKLVAKAFMFNNATIADLKAQYTAINGRRLSRVEALTDFICSRFMEATQHKNKKYRVTQAVNLRTRMDPPFPMLSFGNYSIPHDSTSSVNAEFIKKLQTKDEQINFLKRTFENFSKEEVVSFSFTSLINIPLHDIDFGWGKPLWTTVTAMSTKNVIILLPIKDGLGIEALFTSKEEDMAKFELDNQLLQYVSTPTLKLDAHSRL